MENPEEVLQALDEFKKMRPSEIPRELEEYLSWVAKTGDPVYQWSLVKPLFREKLTRVMTDFYESCPSLELAPCPNVEQFNYDIMKCNLLELLESFANAPFTVQRICELLTAPRKEYNRVDKFMRAIEKNILVVSTIEPGPAGRRSENGDGMVNGSMDDEAPTTQPSHEVEMESWVKDCTSENSVAVPSSDNETPALFKSVAPGVKIADTASGEEIVQTPTESRESESRTEITDAESVSADVDADAVLSARNEERRVASRVEASSANDSETATSMSEIPTAVINEDTNSQPSLDSETEASGSPTARKLQTTFRTKDFTQKDGGGLESYEEEERDESRKIRAETDDSEVVSTPGVVKNDDAPLKSTGDCKLSVERRGAEDSIADAVPEKRARMDRLINDLESIVSVAEEDDSTGKKDSILQEDKTESAASVTLDSPAKDFPDSETEEKTLETRESSEERLSACEAEKIEEIDEENESKKDETFESTDDSLPESERSTATTGHPKPIIEEPNFDEGPDETRDSTSDACETSDSGVTIEEAMDDDTKIGKSIVPDPIPIVEEPKDHEPSIREPVIATTITELPEVAKTPSDIEDLSEPAEAVASTIVVEELSSVETLKEDISCAPDQQDDITDIRCPEETSNSEKIQPAESMEVDGDECLPNFQQGEPMEQEPGDIVKS